MWDGKKLENYQENHYLLPYMHLIILYMCCPPETSSVPTQGLNGWGWGWQRKQRHEGKTQRMKINQEKYKEKNWFFVCVVVCASICVADCVNPTPESHWSDCYRGMNLKWETHRLDDVVESSIELFNYRLFWRLDWVNETFTNAQNLM